MMILFYSNPCYSKLHRTLLVYTYEVAFLIKIVTNSWDRLQIIAWLVKLAKLSSLKYSIDFFINSEKNIWKTCWASFLLYLECNYYSYNLIILWWWEHLIDLSFDVLLSRWYCWFKFTFKWVEELQFLLSKITILYLSYPRVHAIIFSIELYILY